MIDIYAIVLTWLVNMPLWLQVIITIVLSIDLICKVLAKQEG